MDLLFIEPVYDNVVTDIMKNISDLFFEDGISDDVRRQLETTWRNKLIKKLLKSRESNMNEPSSSSLVKREYNQDSTEISSAGKKH